MSTLVEFIRFWHADDSDHVLDRLGDEHITCYLDARGDELAERTRWTRRSELRRLLQCPIERPAGRTSALTARREISDPTSDREVEAWWAWARGCDELTLGQGVRALLALARGCGLDSSEIRRLRLSDVFNEPGQGWRIAVAGPRARDVPCPQRWTSRLRTVVHEAAAVTDPDGYVFRPTAGGRGKNTVNSLIARAHARRSRPLAGLQVARLRSGWLCELIDSGLRLDQIQRRAGLRGARSLERLVVYLPSCSGLADSASSGDGA